MQKFSGAQPTGFHTSFIWRKKHRKSHEMPCLFVCFVCFVALRPKSTAMVIAGRSVHLTTLFSWASLNKQLTSNRAHTFACNWQQPFMNDSAEGRRMTVEIISWSISTKVWDRAGIELATPGSDVSFASVTRHVTDCATQPGNEMSCTLFSPFVTYFGSHYLTTGFWFFFLVQTLVSKLNKVKLSIPLSHWICRIMSHLIKVCTVCLDKIAIFREIQYFSDLS